MECLWSLHRELTALLMRRFSVFENVKCTRTNEQECWLPLLVSRNLLPILLLILCFCRLQDRFAEWQSVFGTCIGCYLTAVCAYLVFGSAEVQFWNFSEDPGNSLESLPNSSKENSANDQDGSIKEPQNLSAETIKHDNRESSTTPLINI